MKPRITLRTAAITLTTLLIPLSMLFGNIVTALYKSTNPSDVDITNDLAYLRESLFAGFGAAFLIGAIIVWLIVLMYRRDKNFSEAKFPLVLLVSLCIVTFAALAVSGYTNAVEDQYTRDYPATQR